MVHLGLKKNPVKTLKLRVYRSQENEDQVFFQEPFRKLDCLVYAGDVSGHELVETTSGSAFLSEGDSQHLRFLT